MMLDSSIDDKNGNIIVNVNVNVNVRETEEQGQAEKTLARMHGS